MPDVIIRLFERHTGFVFIAFTCLNGAVWWWRAQPYIARNPRLKEGYRRLILGWLVWGNVPWLVMAAGDLFGNIRSVFYFFNPRNGPFAVAFFCSVVAMWALTIFWLFFRQGAEQLIEHPGFLNSPVNEPWAVKALTIVMIAFGIVALVTMVLNPITRPSFSAAP
jgi:hypothetical protein